MASSNKATKQAEGQVPVATIAVGEHMHAHGLPHYTDLRFSTPPGEPPSLQVFVLAHNYQVWVASIHVDEEGFEPFSETDLYRFAAAKGRLPVSGVRVQVRCVRRVERAALSAVPA